MPAQKPCKGGKNRPGCGQAIVLAQAGAGVAVLEPYPVLPGHQSEQAVRVVTRQVGGGRTGLSVLARADGDQPGQKWYERHRCITPRNAVAAPHRRAEQLGLDVDVRPPDPGRL